ncbi:MULTISPECIES: ABC transporter ATP-binding protein [Pseudofrankia]|uniref:ABC transporter ATP-binding protein n=1 Tax=Pseudofrankia TaxID=2994363 RepID=UPI000234D141|nr:MULTISPECIES: ATP-binding cassette domain-containing protein [Pseudofrankia]OHV39909.1 glycine/betaine ABC transporter [Pseudofrankia sp. EUN1h]
MPASESMIVLEGVEKTYPDGTVAVADLSFEIGDGELVCLVGPSGCGKTTTMKMINRLVEPTAGRILLAGEDVRSLDPVKLRRRLGYVIQQVGLFPHLTVRANVGCVPRLLRWNRARTRARADELLELVGLDPAVVGDRYPHELSGGQQQRVGVARALAADPPVLLMDEPFSAIDPIARARLQDEFARLRREISKTIVFVTHDIDEAIRLADRVAVFRAGPDGGRLEQIDTPARILAHPATPFVADFTGAERTLRRLDVLPLRRDALEPAAAADGSPDGSATPSIVIGSMLSEALTALLARDDARLPVYEAGNGNGDGPSDFAGYLTPASLHAALRSAEDG